MHKQSMVYQKKKKKETTIPSNYKPLKFQKSHLISNKINRKQKIIYNIKQLSI